MILVIVFSAAALAKCDEETSEPVNQQLFDALSAYITADDWDQSLEDQGLAALASAMSLPHDAEKKLSYSEKICKEIRDNAEKARTAYAEQEAKTEPASAAQSEDTEIVNWLDEQFHDCDDWERIYTLAKFPYSLRDTVRAVRAAQGEKGGS